METTTESLPVLRVEVKGEVVASNVEAFREAFAEWVGGFNMAPATDEEFARAVEDSKTLQRAEKDVLSVKDEALAQAEDLHNLFAVLDDMSAEIREKRLALDRQVRTRREEIRAEIVEEAVSAIDGGHGERFRADIETAIKRLRTLDTMRAAARGAAEEANERIRACVAALDAFEAEHGRELVMDRRALETSQPEVLEAELMRRVEAHRAEEERRKAEEERRRLEAELAAERRKAEEERRKQAELEAAEAERKRREKVIDRVDRLRAEAERKHAEMKSEMEDTLLRGVPDPDTPDPFAPKDPGLADEMRRKELQEFIYALEKLFGALREERAKLKDYSNTSKVNRFAQAVNAAYQELLSEM